MKKAVTKVDLLYSNSNRFDRLYKSTKELCEEYMEKYPMAISFSGGKDSTVMLDIMENINYDIRSVFYDSGLEFDETYELIEYYQSDIVHPEYNMIEMLHLDGVFGCEPDKQEQIPIDYSYYLVVEPSIRYCKEIGINTMAIGLRANESAGRCVNFNSRGHFYSVKEQPNRFLPMSRWTENDIWAYIAKFDCEYNKIYDMMTEHNIPREDQRVSTLIGGRGANHGRYTRLKMIKPQLWNKLCSEFPELSRYI